MSKYLYDQIKLDALQSQINPHFLFNTLESMRGYAYRCNQPKLAEIIEAMSSLFRTNLTSTDELIPLEEEVKNVENYLMIQRFRFSDRLKTSIDIGLEDVKNCYVPNLILQPIIENCISHGLVTKMGDAKITVKYYLSEDRLIIEIKDNGSGMSIERLSEIQNKLIAGVNPISSKKTESSSGTGIGIINVNNRIQHLFGSLYGLSIMSTEGYGTETDITLPIILSEDLKCRTKDTVNY